MRYILDSEGYIYEASLGADILCEFGHCTEYKGAIPSGYATIEEWFIEESYRINAWKIVEGNLVFDPERAAELEWICNEQARLNRHVTYGEVEGMLNNLDITVSNEDELAGILPIRTEEGEVIYVDDASSYPFEKITIISKDTISDELNLYISTSNMLPNEAQSDTKNGVRYTVHDDKSISLSGNLTDSFRTTISGSENNTKPLFIFKANTNYYINKVSNKINLNLYSNDGTGRLLVYLGGGGQVINLGEDTAITHVEISIPCDNLITELDESILTEMGLSLLTENSTTSINETIYLMISVGSTSKEYEQCFYTIVPINLYNNTFEPNDEMIIEYGLVQIEGRGVDIIDMPCTYYEKTTIYADKCTYLEVDYKKSGFDTVTKSGRGKLNLKNTADGYGSVFGFTIEDLEGGKTYTLETSDGDTQSERYNINLTSYTGDVDVVIEKGRASVYRGNSYLGSLGNIYIRTYSPRTYIELIGCDNRMTCEYMLESDFSIYCTRVEKDASIKVVEDMIKLEVSRASETEGQLRSSITIEANKIEQIVENVGNSAGEVTPASIVAAINDAKSSVKISADHIDIEGTEFPSIRNSKGTAFIDSEFEIGSYTCIGYKAQQHRFLNDDEDLMFRIVGNAVEVHGDMITIGTSCPYIQIGGSGTTLVINGKAFDGTARFG